MTVERLAAAMDVEVNEIILLLMEENIMATKNQVLELELVRKIADQFGFTVQTVIPEEEDLFKETPDDPTDLVLRAPVVTVMGHVDHGKTSLLDMVRRASVAEGEAGGITQHIAAYDVKLDAGRVVFLDTPGHEAFTQMRARGAGVTDIVVLVVAADDGVKPQTIEAIDHARAAGVPIVVAVNKCDKPEAQPDRVRQELTKYELVPEEWGGSTIMKNISAKMGDGVDELMELLALQAEMLELKANPNKSARGAIVESEMSTGHGPVAWVLVQSGTLRNGDAFISGETYGRVRNMTDSQGRNVEEAGPSTPVLVTGFSAVPVAGDPFVSVAEERAARSVAEKRASLNRQKRGAAVRHMTLEDFHAQMLVGEKKMLNVIVKADVQGSVDVLQSSLSKLGNEEVKVSIVHSGVGAISESDVLLASASDAVVLGFHIGANARTRQVAEAEGVEIRTYLVIYELIEDVRKALEGMLTPDTQEIIVGHAEIREVFRSSAFGNIAGCIQQDGQTTRGGEARILRDGRVVYTGRIATVRREKEDVRSVVAGLECGIRLEKFDDIQVGDVIEAFRIEKVAKKL
jgi:translation initiation factor IF-2